MSAIAVIYERANAPVETGVLARVMDRLKHRGPDGSDVYQADRVALGHCHFWITPEEQGEKQPLCLPGLPFKIVFDGRLDNRDELMEWLGFQLSEAGQISDAALVVHAYAHWGEDCLKRFLGEFAFAILDEQRSELILARDPLGDRTLFYSRKGSRFVIASEPWAVTAAKDSPPELNESAVAHYFSFQVPEDGQTLFKDVYELLPAHIMIIDATRERLVRYWKPDFSRRLRGLTDVEYAGQFRTLLEKSVRCRLRSSAPVGVLMSGGLDSTSVACTAAHISPDVPLTAISYVFNELTTCDERMYIDAVKDKYSLKSIQIPCDDLWPFGNWKDMPHNPNQPEGNPYRMIKERAYERARQEGVRVLLTGGFGDHLYSAGMDWLADLLAEGKFQLAAHELALYIRYAGWRWTLSAGFISRVVRRIVDSIPGGNHLHRRKKPLNWLTSYSKKQLSASPASGQFVGDRPGNVLSLLASRGSSGEIYNSNRHELELRHPYRDRRLVEFVLSIPAHQLYFHGRYKHVLRNAMRGILPEIIRTRRKPTSLVPLYLRGVERESKWLQGLLESADSHWYMYVRQEWVKRFWNVKFNPEEDGPHALIPWLCISFNSWNESVFPSYNQQGVVL